MKFLFRRKKPKPEKSKSRIFQPHEVATTMNPSAMSIDSDGDGTPDWMQRPSLPSLVKEQSDVALKHVDTQRELEKLKMHWRGYEYSPKVSRYVPVSPLMINEQGIMEFSSILDPLINRHTMNSNISEDWAHNQTMRISLVIAALIRDKRKVFGIDKANRDMIVETVDAFIYNVYSRAINDGQREHEDKRMSMTGNLQGQPQPGM